MTILQPETFLELSGALALGYVLLVRDLKRRARALQLPAPPDAGSPEAPPTLAPARTPADDPAPGPRLEALARSHGRAAIPALAEALRHPDPVVAERAANLLGEIGGEAALAALLAADTEAPAGSPRAAPPEAPAAPEAPAEAGAASEAVARWFHTPFQAQPGEPLADPEGDASAPPAMRLYEPLARNDFRALHRYTPHDPRQLDEAAVAAALLKLAANHGEKPALRYFAVKNLARFQHPDIAESLLDLLEDPLPLVRYAAAEGLAVHGDQEAVSALVESLEDAEGSVRASAAHTLAVLGGDMAIRPLLSLRDDEDEVVRYAARRALEAIGERKKIGPLLRRAPNASRRRSAR